MTTFKRAVGLIMSAVLLVFILCSCRFKWVIKRNQSTSTGTVSQSSAVSEDNNISSILEQTGTSDVQSSGTNSTVSSEESSANQSGKESNNQSGDGIGQIPTPTPNPTPIPTPNPNPDSNSNPTPTLPPPPPVADIPDQEPNGEPVIPPTENQIHTKLAEDKYYQFSQMTDKEKTLYLRIKTAANIYQNSVNVEDLGFTMAEATSVIKRFTADFPQYFWLARQFGFTYYNSPEHLATCYLLYTDGSVNDNMEGTVTADRSKIAAQRTEVENKVKEIVSTISITATDYEKELFIHDYLAGSMQYDHDAATHRYVNGTDVLKPAFSVLGAFINNKGVCEAYTKAFQYLCYEVGINANQVSSSNHMWNVVLIDGEWYQVDVTWDDPSNLDIVIHTHMNLTSAEMYAIESHTPEFQNSCLKVPDCTATKYKYPYNAQNDLS